MFESLDKVDWDLLHQQKLVLLAMRKQHRGKSPEANALIAHVASWPVPRTSIVTLVRRADSDEGRVIGLATIAARPFRWRFR